MHEVIPGKMFAMRGPKNIDGEYKDVIVDGSFSHREFSALHYASILQELNVQVVVRLNGPVYDAQDFVDAGNVLCAYVLFSCSENLIVMFVIWIRLQASPWSTSSMKTVPRHP